MRFSQSSVGYHAFRRTVFPVGGVRVRDKDGPITFSESAFDQ